MQEINCKKSVCKIYKDNKRSGMRYKMVYEKLMDIYNNDKDKILIRSLKTTLESKIALTSVFGFIV